MDEQEAYAEVDRLNALIKLVFMWMATKGVLDQFKQDSLAAYDGVESYTNIEL